MKNKIRKSGAGTDTAETIYKYAWGNNEKRRSLQGRLCRIVTSGKKNTVLVEFIDTGMMELVSRRALWRIEN